MSSDQLLKHTKPGALVFVQMNLGHLHKVGMLEVGQPGHAEGHGKATGEVGKQIRAANEPLEIKFTLVAKEGVVINIKILAG